MTSQNKPPAEQSGSGRLLIAALGVIAACLGFIMTLQSYSNNPPKLYIGTLLVLAGVATATVSMFWGDHSRHRNGTS